MGLINKHSQKIIRFGIAGIFITFIYISVGLLLMHINGLNKALSSPIAFIIANICSYLIHTRWSFSTNYKIKNFTRFYVVSFIGLMVSWGAPILGRAYDFNEVSILLITSLIIPIVSFMLHSLWTYRS